MLLDTFGRDLGQLAHNYFRPADIYYMSVLGKEGCFEEAINETADVDLAGGLLHGACYGGYRELAITLLATGGKCHPNVGLVGACRGRQPELVELMYAHGADREHHFRQAYACYGGCT